MTELLETVLTTHVAITAVLAGGIQEAIKRSVMGLDKAKKFHGGPWFATVQALTPLALGAGIGMIVIPTEGAVTEPWVLGVLAGLFSSQVYNTVKPGLEKMLTKKVEDATSK